MKSLDPVFKALADPSRRKILELLRDSPKTTGAISDAFEFSRYGVMKHLSVLEDAKLITVRRKGRERWNYLNATPLKELYEHYVKPYEATWASSLLNLKQYVEIKEDAVFESPSALSLDIAQDIQIDMPAERVFTALTQEISNWWTPQHLHKEAVGLVLESQVGGRFYEVWKEEGAGRLLGTVSVFHPHKQLEITGRLHLGVVQGVMRFVLEPEGKATLLRFSHQAIGDVSADIAASFDQGWKALLAKSFKSYVEQSESFVVKE